MLKKFTSVRFILSMLLLLSVMFAGYSIYYKVKYWGFEISPKTVSDVWTIEAHISFEPTGEPVTVSLTQQQRIQNSGRRRCRSGIQGKKGQ